MIDSVVTHAASWLALKTLSEHHHVCYIPELYTKLLLTLNYKSYCGNRLSHPIIFACKLCSALSSIVLRDHGCVCLEEGQASYTRYDACPSSTHTTSRFFRMCVDIWQSSLHYYEVTCFMSFSECY